MGILSININFYVIGRALKKNLMTVLMISIIMGTMSFMGTDYFIPKTYTTTMNLSVIANSNLTNNLSSRKITAAVKRYVSIFEKDMMTNKICADLGTSELPGNMEVSYIYASNVVVVEFTANSPVVAFQMMESFKRNYQSVASQVSGNYQIKVLGMTDVYSMTTSENRSFIIALLVAAIGLVVGMGVIVFVKIFEGRIQDIKQVEREIDADFLGSIMCEKKKKKQSLLITNKDVSYAYIESIKKIASRIIYTASRKKYKTIVITSTLAGEGKSTISANIALAIAQQGKRVMLVDADLRMCTQYKVFGQRDYFDLGHYLEGEDEIGQIIKKENEDLFYCALSKETKEDSDELLENGRMKAFLEKASEEVDFVIIDAPPAGIVRDAEILSTYADAAVLVIRQEKAKIPMINDMIDTLGQEKMEIMGCVLNALQSKTVQIDENNTYYKKNREFANSYDY